MPPYPLAELLEFRAIKVQELETQYAAACARLARAQTHVAGLCASIQRGENMISAAQARLVASVAQGVALASDLQQTAQFRAGQAAVIERLKTDEQQARLAVEQCRAYCGETNQMLVASRRQLTVVERHYRMFQRQQRLLEERKAEQEAGDLWQAHVATRERRGLQ